MACTDPFIHSGVPDFNHFCSPEDLDTNVSRERHHMVGQFGFDRAGLIGVCCPAMPDKGMFLFFDKCSRKSVSIELE